MNISNTSRQLSTFLATLKIAEQINDKRISNIPLIANLPRFIKM